MTRVHMSSCQLGKIDNYWCVGDLVRGGGIFKSYSVNIYNGGYTVGVGPGVQDPLPIFIFENVDKWVPLCCTVVVKHVIVMMCYI